MAKRAGRKRKSGVRYENGRLKKKSAALIAKENRQTVVEARQRVLGVSAETAAEEGSGSALGRMFNPRDAEMARLYEAGKAFEITHRRYLHAKAYPAAKSPSDFERVGGHDGSDGTDAEYVRRCKRAITDWNGVRHAVLSCGAPMGMFALQTIILDDREMPSLRDQAERALSAIASAGY